MKKIISTVAIVVILVSFSAQATVIFHDKFGDNGDVVWSMAGQPDETASLNTNLALRQTGPAAPSTYSTDLIGGSTGIRTCGIDNEALFRTAGPGGNAPANLDHDFGADVPDSLWTVSIKETKTGGNEVGNYTYLAVGSSPVAGSGIGCATGVIGIEGYVNGRLDFWVNGTEVWTLHSGVSLTGREYTYMLYFNEVLETVYGTATTMTGSPSVAITFSSTTNSFSGVFGSGSRYIEKRCYLAGGGASTDNYVKDLTVEVVPEPATLGLLAILGLAFLRKKVSSTS